LESNCTNLGLRYACAANMARSFHTADRQTYRRVAAVGLVLCAAFVVISFSLRPQPDGTHVLVKADRQVRTAGEARQAH
jgi:hypothetical protein